MSDYASESGHYYWPDGRPAYTTIAKNGNERPTTLRDARKLGLVPSVTGIIKCAAAPGLEKWKRDKVLLSALTLPRMPNEPEADWIKRVEQDWQEEGRAAAQKGEAIHGAIERFFREELVPLEWEPWIQVVNQAVYTACGPQQWAAERSFAHPLGYGGKTDLHSPEWVVDVKTKDGDLTDCKVWPEHEMQDSAYRTGLGVKTARCGILFVSRTEVAARFMEINEDDLVKGWQMFFHLLQYWQVSNNHFPGTRPRLVA